MARTETAIDRILLPGVGHALNEFEQRQLVEWVPKAAVKHEQAELCGTSEDRSHDVRAGVCGLENAPTPDNSRLSTPETTPPLIMPPARPTHPFLQEGYGSE